MSSQTCAFVSQQATGRFTKTQIKTFLPNNGNTDFDGFNRADLPKHKVKDLLLRKYLFSKWSDPTPDGVERRYRATLDKYLQCEARCKVINESLDSLLLSDKDLRIIMCIARQDIYNVLGTFRTHYFGDLGDFGPGATTRLRRPFIDASFKFEGTPHCTTMLLPYIKEWAMPLFDDILEQNSARFTTVPKNDKIDRAIEVQPDLNIFFQKSLGSNIRKKMLGLEIGSGFKFDLNDQNINRELARLGSIDGKLSTIDLSSASDTISTKLVSLLLPLDWLAALSICRTPTVIIDHKELSLEKFSAMGNGYTWELQSLIFWALTKATLKYYNCSTPIVSTFGDDIICNTSHVSFVMDVLSKVGFTINQDKSFTTGYLRESCGKFYYSGYDVTPFYIRQTPTEVIHLYSLHNRLLEWMYRDGFLDERYKAFAEFIRTMCPIKYNLDIPFGYSDCGFYTCKSRATFIISCKGNRWRLDRYLFTSLHRSQAILSWAGVGCLHKTLLRGSVETQIATDIPFGTSRDGCAQSRSCDWPILGPWI